MNYQAIYSKIIDNRKSNPPAEGYSEVHHILPRSLGGTNDSDNLVRLTAREHFIVHYLLAKMYPKDTLEWYKMNNAFLMMKCKSISNDLRYFNSRLYEALKGNFSDARRFMTMGSKNPGYGTMWIHNPVTKENKKHPKAEPIPEGWIKGRKGIFTEEQLKEMGNRSRGKKLGPRSPETKEKIRIANSGKKPSPETKEKIRMAIKNRSPEERERIRLVHLGKKRSPETREKIRQARLNSPNLADHMQKMRNVNPHLTTSNKMI